MATSSDRLKATLNQEFPISLKEIEPLIVRVHDRYPYLSSYEITMIVKTFFETMRYLLLVGETISLNRLASNIKLLSFSKIINDKRVSATKIKLTTPRKMKK